MRNIYTIYKNIIRYTCNQISRCLYRGNDECNNNDTINDAG